MAKPRLLFYLKPEALEVYSDQAEAPARLDFPTQILSHQEVLDTEKYTQLLNDFLTQMGIAQLEVTVLIAQPLIFSREFPYQESTTAEDPNKPLLDYNVLNTKIQAYIDGAPFDNNHISKLELKGETSSLILITNKALYQPIVDIVNALMGKVLSVVPITVLGDLAQKPNLDGGDVDLVFGDRKTLQTNNFLLSQNMTNPQAGKVITSDISDDGDEEEEASAKKNKLLLIFGAIFIVGGLVVLAMMLGLLKNPLDKPQAVKVSNNLQTNEASTSANIAVVVATDSATPATGSAALQEVKKDLMTINIINGSGISGQGSKVKTILTSLGYKDINIAGTSITGTTDTLIDYSVKVTPLVRQEIDQELGKAFLSVKSTDASPSSKFDVVITTGVYK